MSATASSRNIARVLLLVALLATWKLTSDALYGVFDADSPGSPWKLPLILLGVLVTCGGIIGLGCVKWGKSSLRELGWRFDRPALLALTALLLTILESAMVYGAYAITDGSEGVRKLTAALAEVSFRERTFFFAMGSVVAFVEETLFRGDLLRACLAHSGSAVAVVASSMVFALYHLDLTPLPLAMKFAYGAIFAVATLRTGSLVPAAIAHALMWTIFAYN